MIHPTRHPNINQNAEKLAAVSLDQKLLWQERVRSRCSK